MSLRQIFVGGLLHNHISVGGSFISLWVMLAARISPAACRSRQLILLQSLMVAQWMSPKELISRAEISPWQRTVPLISAQLKLICATTSPLIEPSAITCPCTFTLKYCVASLQLRGKAISMGGQSGEKVCATSIRRRPRS